ncbi:toll/interleukin-1 receptor domain-containing protein [Actinoplanes sp. NPDC049265]|uniref:toll/interleukin-1 receptor domain-containing protein n=1 Tax=Actinoplanes sp. NPDC049265 TaxID=3363902 RepID=UPI00371A7735
MNGNPTEFVVEVVGVLAGLASAWFAYLQVKRRRRAVPGPAAGPPLPAGAPYDAFIAYAPEDAGRATDLAHGLEARGLKVFLAEWLDAGLIEMEAKQDALTRSANGVLLYTRSTMSQRAMVDDFAAIMNRVHSGGRLFVPVLLENVELTGYAGSRKALDFSDRSRDRENLDRLARSLRRGAVSDRSPAG